MPVLTTDEMIAVQATNSASMTTKSTHLMSNMVLNAQFGSSCWSKPCPSFWCFLTVSWHKWYILWTDTHAEQKHIDGPWTGNLMLRADSTGEWNPEISPTLISFLGHEAQEISKQFINDFQSDKNQFFSADFESTLMLLWWNLPWTVTRSVPVRLLQICRYKYAYKIKLHGVLSFVILSASW